MAARAVVARVEARAEARVVVARAVARAGAGRVGARAAVATAEGTAEVAMVAERAAVARAAVRVVVARVAAMEAAARVAARAATATAVVRAAGVRAEVRAAAARAVAARAVACRSSRSPGNGSSQYLHDPRTSMSKPDSCMYFLLSHNAGNTQPVVVAAVVVRHSLEAKACARPCALGSATAAELICSCESARGATLEVHPRVGLRLSRARSRSRPWQVKRTNCVRHGC